MNDKENYRAVFSQLHTSVIVDMEDINNMKKTKFRSNARVAIVVVIMACLLMAISAAAETLNFLGLKDLVIPNESSSKAADCPIIKMLGLEKFVSFPASTSLQGYAGSNEYEAAAEWHAFLETYDKDGSLLAEVGNKLTDVVERPTALYFAYTHEMADKLDEITKKYNLKYHREMILLEDQADIIKKAANGNFIGDTNIAYCGYMYDDGTFQFDGIMRYNRAAYSDYFEGIISQYNPKTTSPEERYDLHTITPETLMVFVPYGGTNEDAVVADVNSTTGEVSFIPYEEDFDISTFTEHTNTSDLASVYFSFRYCVKGYFDEVTGRAVYISDYTDWEYETACGITVTLSQSKYDSWIILDLDNAFVTIGIGDTNTNFTATELEAFADSFDFTLLK